MQGLVSSDKPLYDRLNPFHSKVIKRYRLNKAGSTKETWHIVLDLKGSSISYRPGDSIAIFPENHPSLVEAILQSQSFDRHAQVLCTRSNQEFHLAEWLLKKVNLSKPTTKLVEKLQVSSDLIDLHNVAELLDIHKGHVTSAQELTGLLSPLLPRFYSIASSQTSVGDEVHCTIANVHYEINERARFGVCSHFLCSLIEEHETKVGVYIQPTKDFMLPEDNSVPIIMIGPGTGVAPYRAFMQERMYRKNPTYKNWLFFGERSREHDFLYEEFWQSLVEAGFLRLDVAFSRDQEHKVYVQHKMWQARHEIWQWLQEGAHIYVCGDASKMAKDVEAMLLQIISSESGLDQQGSKAYLTALRKEKRYLRDVY